MRATNFLLITATALVTLSTALAFGQPIGFGPGFDRAPGERTERRVAFLDRRLNLSDLQESAISDLLNRRHTDARTWHEDHPDATLEERAEFHRGHVMETREAIAAELNPEQLAIFENMDEALGSGMLGRRGRHARFMEDTGITSEQADLIRAIRTERRVEAETWREQHPDATAEERTAFRAQLREKAFNQMEAVLTGEQLAALRSYRQGRPDGRRGSRSCRLADVVEQLNLTEEQAAELRDVVAELRTDRPGRDELAQMSRAERRSLHTDRIDSFISNLESTLTGEQLSTLEELRADGRCRGPKRGAGPMHRLRGELDLTDEQESQLRDALSAHREAGGTWRAENPDASADEIRRFRETHRDSHRAIVESILTQEQLEMWKSFRSSEGRFAPGRGGCNMPSRGNREMIDPPTEPENSRFDLSNYPNPANPTTQISFTLRSDAHVTLRVFDLRGRQVAELLNSEKSAGNHTVAFNSENLPTGTYLYRLTADGLTEAASLSVVK